MVIFITNLKVTENFARENSNNTINSGMISINGVNQLIPYTTSGNGTSKNPYYITNLSIDCGSDQNYNGPTVGLYITNVNSYFVLSNITAKNCYYGISLQNVNNSVITHSHVTTSDFAIEEDIVSHSVIQDNYLYKNNDGGLFLTNLSYCTIQNNVVNLTTSYSSTGISISTNSYYDNVSSNIVLDTTYWSFELQLNDGIIQNNTAIKGAIGFKLDSYNTEIMNNTATNQSTGFEIDGNSNLVHNNSAYFNSNGFYVYNSEHNTCVSNNVSYNTNDGIYIYYAYYDSFYNNTVSYNKANGFDIIGSLNMTIKYNLIANNTNNLYQDTSSSNNTIISNYFYPTGTSNSGNSGGTSSGSNTGSKTTTSKVSTNETLNNSTKTTSKNLSILNSVIVVSAFLVMMTYRRKKNK